ncbi:ABC transporter substrate-binding protein [Rubellimicrobium sp. CFH 75288]|uniref:ABC transporter substrate-binding protein n=1 Tax=Rubellimicrobium sp. CFH 75288 TaxID=2697034 RepID=UPI0014120801|nr:ABC transporter substrate-binding protein [Rubellimicrobium sp. CFH 75288]NAZ38284.1 ABC transporter substrate-binding protein [Rubellimicrobium sp. CFH 75288]
MPRPLPVVLALIFAGPAFGLDCPSGQRPFGHPAGETCIPIAPQRIVTLSDQNGLLPLLELGIVPVGSAGHAAADGTPLFRRTEGFDTSTVVHVGSYQAPDREAVAALAPDLIIATPWPEGQVEAFSPIAPTIVFDPFGQPLDVALLNLADAVGRSAEAERLRADLRARAEALRSRIGGRLTSVSTSFIAPQDGRSFWPETGGQAAGLAFRLLGIRRVPAQEALAPGEGDELGFEALPEHMGDLLFVLTYDGEGAGATMAAFLADPLVQALPVAEADQIVEIVGTETVGAAWGKARAFMEALAAAMSRPGLRDDLFIE